MLRELRERVSKGRAERRATKTERLRKRAEVDAYRRKHKRSGSGAGGA